MEDPISKSIYLNPVTEDEILKIVPKLKNKHSTGYDDLSINTINKYIKLISKPLTYICNKSLENKTFPKKKKITKVIPLFKTCDKKLFSNDQPVSLVPQFSKILEKCTFNIIY